MGAALLQHPFKESEYVPRVATVHPDSAHMVFVNGPSREVKSLDAL
jgi:hypothetical protein